MTLKVLFVSSVSGIGGAELSFIELIEHLDPRCCQPILYVEQAGPLVERLDQHAVPVVWGEFPFFRKRNPLAYWLAVQHMWATIRDRRINLVHINCDRAVPISVTASRLSRVPSVCYIHDFLRAWYLPRYVRILNRAQCIAADSHAVAARCMEAGMRREKIRVIYESVTTSASSAANRDSMRTELGLRSDAIVIGIIGKVVRHKGHEELLRAFAIASARVHALQLLVIGDTSMTGDDTFPDYLIELTKELDITHQVVFGGFRNDIAAVMSTIDVLAIPSHTEAFGRSAAEALAAGVPVIASDVGGLPEIVQDHVTGLLVPPKAIEPLADAILLLAGDVELRRSMGSRGPAIAARFDISNHVQEFMGLYSDLMGRNICGDRPDVSQRPKTNGVL